MRLRLWWSIAVATSVWGMFFGGAIGLALAWISGDYVVTVSSYVSLGLRAGLLVGTIFAGCRDLSPHPVMCTNEALRALAVSSLVAAGALGVGTAAGLCVAL